MQTGTGTNAQIPGVRVAGKTGTAQTARRAAPARLVHLVRARRRPAGRRRRRRRERRRRSDEALGGRVAAPIAQAVMEAVLEAMTLTPEAASDERYMLPRRHRRRWHGRGLGGHGRRPRPDGRRQDAARASTRTTTRFRRAVPGRGAHGRAGCRTRGSPPVYDYGETVVTGSAGVPRHGARARRGALGDPRPARARSAPTAPSTCVAQAARALHAAHERGRHPPRRQAGQPPGHARRPGQGDRLRHRPARRPRAADRDRAGHGHGALPRAGAGPRAGRDAGVRHLRPRRRRVRVPRRPAPVRG